MNEQEKQVEAEGDGIDSMRIKFAVNETPYCFWDLDIHGKNLEFNLANRQGNYLLAITSDPIEKRQCASTN